MHRARRSAPALIAAASAVLLLTGCHVSVISIPIGSPPKATGTVAPVPTSSGTPTPAPTVTANTADYLLSGTPYQPDADGAWSGHYGFWTDASHAVACDITIFSGDSGGVTCAIAPGHEGQRSYSLPSGVSANCDVSSSNPADGTAIAINYKVFDGNQNVGFSGCASQYDASFDAARKVLPPNALLSVSQQGFEDYRCTVSSGQASCADSTPGSSFVFGLTTASFTQG